MKNNLVGKSVDLELEGLDGNAHMILGAFSKQAKREGWTQEEIDKVKEAAKEGDYWHLVEVVGNHCK